MTARCDYCDNKLPEGRAPYCNEFCRGAARRGRIHPRKVQGLLAPLQAQTKAVFESDFITLLGWRQFCTLRSMIASAPPAERDGPLNTIIELLLDMSGLREKGREAVRAARERWDAAREQAEQDLEDGKIGELPEHLREPFEEPPGAA